MLDSTELQADNGTMTENQKSVPCDQKSNRSVLDKFSYESSDGDGWSESIIDCPRGVDYSRNNIEPFEKDSVFYMDKSVMDCELPEIIVCYKESTYHVVKDICVDDGVPSKDKFFFENGVDEKSLSTLLPRENTEFMQGKPTDAVKTSAENDFGKNMDNLCDTMDLMPTGKIEDDATEKIVDGHSKEKISLGDMLAMEKLHPESSDSKFSNVDRYAAELPSVQSSSGRIEEMHNDSKQTEELALASASEELNDGGKQTEESFNDSEESILAGPTQASATRESDAGSDATITVKPAVDGTLGESSPSNDLGYNSKVETGSITFHFESSAPAASGGEECPQTPDCQSIETQNSHLVTSQAQHSQGESSFSMAGPISGSISYSGPIAYSGSLSLRSDSSTTSTRSFAFPILQSEWNSSPVRMAKADRRHYRKHRGWRLSVLCCRF